MDLGIDFQQFNQDAAQVQAEQQARMAIDPNYTGGLTDYELNKEAERQKQMAPFRPGISDAEPAPGEMGPVDLTDQFTYDDPLDNMPGSTARVHYTPEGDYTLGMTQRKKEKAAESMAAASCPEGYEYDRRQQKCVPAGTRSRSKVGNFLKKGVDAWKGMSAAEKVNTGLAVGNYAVGAKEEQNRREYEEQVKNKSWEDQFVMAYKPSDSGKYMTNMDVMVPPTQQTPVQFSGRNYMQGTGYAKEGGSVMYLTEKQIRDIISLGGEVEFIK